MLTLTMPRRLWLRSKPWLKKPPAVLALLLMPVLASYSLWTIGQSVAPAFPAINLSNQPLYAAASVDKPTLALALSVEYPTVGSQYTPGGSLDNTYSPATEYLGYYDAESCYSYNNAPSETPATGLTTADYKRFDRSAAATSRRCTGETFSGNFLNWASNSAIDMLRIALSGGDRYIDTADLTILQRAVLPNGNPVCMWNSSNFPAKQLVRDSGNYLGAVPASMRTASGNNDIWVANTLNRIYFGTSRTGTCGDTGAYTLGGAASQIGPITNSNSSRPTTTLCAAENGYCSFNGVKEVWYGATVLGVNYWRVAPAYNGVSCTNGVFGDPISGTAKSCYIRDYTGTWQPNTAGQLNTDGFFYARVQVCNINSSGALQDNRDYGLCRQYPSGKYKPSGVIQKYSDQMRLAAFGYLIDQVASYNNGRYGGVLRAPMKYVGSKTFDIYGRDNTPSTGNLKAEWNANTGVFLNNPEGDTSFNSSASSSANTSGVINYLNKFGRTGVQGMYKIYDPVGELHYEVLRYLQGMTPTAAATTGMTDAMKDGFPAYDTWTDPYGDGRSNAADYSCVKSNIVVIGDINTHDGNRLPTASTAGNVPDISAWRSVVQNFERNSGGTYVDGRGNTQTISNPNTANNSVPSGTQTSQIMGTAYWSHMRDIRGTGWTNEPTKQRPGLRVKSFLFDVNEYGDQNNVNTRRFANQFFMAAKYGGYESDPSNRGGRPYNTKGNPFQREDGTNDNNVWQKQSDPGEASTYYLQSSARGVLTAFDEIFSRAATSARSIAGGAASSSTVSSSTTLYTARFDTSNWSGDVIAEPITADATTRALSAGTQLWSAASQLDTRASAATTRNIVAGREAASGTSLAMDFTWSAIQGTNLQTHLTKASPTASADSLGQARLDFIRGDRTREGNPFRVRSSLLGDIVNSNVVFSGAPPSNTNDASYVLFRNANLTRTQAVFAGANDGMVHAFNASNGSELFAYIPSWFGPQLSALTDSNFVNNHQNYADAPLAVGEVKIASAGAATDWKTVLVGGTGDGGSGVFALDVTNPAAFDNTKLLWEFKRSDDADMGEVIGAPKLLKFKTSATNAATTTYRWFAVVASGVNNYVPDSANRYSTTGNPALFLLALDKPATQAWALGTNYFKISLPIDNLLAAASAPGVANFSALYGSNGEVTDLYAGDLHGKVWRISFGKATNGTTDWNMNKLSFFNKGTASAPSPYPLYSAKTAAGVLQPITAAPTLFTGPIVNSLETFYVLFGTGKYLESGDNVSTLTNSFYAVYDNGSTAADASPVVSAISGRGRLQAGTVNTTTKTISVAAFTWGRPNGDSVTTSRAGWYFDFPSGGEKLVSNILDLSPTSAAFNTVIPGTAGSTLGSCTNTPGSGNQYVMSVQGGSGRFLVSNVGIPGPAMFFVNQSGETTETKSDSTGRRIRTSVQRGLTVGQGGVSASAPQETVTETVGRLSWRQIYYYQEMKSN